MFPEDSSKWHSWIVACSLGFNLIRSLSFLPNNSSVSYPKSSQVISFAVRIWNTHISNNKKKQGLFFELKKCTWQFLVHHDHTFWRVEGFHYYLRSLWIDRTNSFIGVSYGRREHRPCMPPADVAVEWPVLSVRMKLRGPWSLCLTRAEANIMELTACHKQQTHFSKCYYKVINTCVYESCYLI